MSGDEPFEWLAEQYLAGSDGLQARMASALRDLLKELPNPVLWPAMARNNFLALIQSCGQRIASDVFESVRTCRMIQVRDPYHIDTHAGLLKCLIALGRLSDPSFWLKQLGLLGPQYGALIFSGLASHGLDLQPSISVYSPARMSL